MTDDLFSIAPWHTIEAFWNASVRLKEDFPLPDYVLKIAAGTAAYEDIIRKLWEEFKKNPTEATAQEFVDALVEASDELWSEVLQDVLDVEQLSDEQQEFLQSELETHHRYMRESLLPDVVGRLQDDERDMSGLDYRVIFLYAGALWSLGYLANTRFAGLVTRNPNDLFVFTGPNDSETCDGDRGCQQYVGNIYTVAEIMEQDIIPGHLRCLTNCRHVLVYIEDRDAEELGYEKA